jgi:hypothetical protein
MIIVIEALQCNSNVMHYFAMQLPPVLTHGPLLRRASTTYHIVLLQSKHYHYLIECNLFSP